MTDATAGVHRRAGKRGGAVMAGYGPSPSSACDAACTDMWRTIRPSDARHLGDTHGDPEADTHGDSVSPSCIPHPACKFQHKYKALRSACAQSFYRLIAEENTCDCKYK